MIFLPAQKQKCKNKTSRIACCGGYRCALREQEHHKQAGWILSTTQIGPQWLPLQVAHISENNISSENNSPS
jgi:hypothetical protein